YRKEPGQPLLVAQNLLLASSLLQPLYRGGVWGRGLPPQKGGTRLALTSDQRPVSIVNTVMRIGHRFSPIDLFARGLFVPAIAIGGCADQSRQVTAPTASPPSQAA